MARINAFTKPGGLAREVCAVHGINAFTKPGVSCAARAVVRDTQTRQIIARGTVAECRAFVNAFGQCYLEKLSG